MTGGAPRPDQLGVDDKLPDLVRTITSVDLMAYGAATWDWHRLHHDGPYAKAAGMEAPVVDGQMFGALLAQQVIEALGPDVDITRVHFRNRVPVRAGETITITAVVDNVDGEHLSVAQQVLVDDVPVVTPAGVEFRL